MSFRRSVFAAITLSVLAVPASAAPPTDGTISVVMAGAEEGDDAAADQFRTAAAQALATKGFTLLEGAGHAAYRMELSVHVSDAGTGMAKVAPTKPGLLNGMMGAVGSGVKIAVPSNKARIVGLQRTQLDMTLRKRGADAPLWRGSAVTVRSEARGDVAADLCNALLRAYPDQSDTILGVP